MSSHSLAKILNRPRGKHSGNWAKGRAMLAAKRRERHRHVDEIVARVWAVHPRDAAARSRMIARWSRLLWANDRSVARELLAVVPLTARRKVA